MSGFVVVPNSFVFGSTKGFSPGDWALAPVAPDYTLATRRLKSRLVAHPDGRLLLIGDVYGDPDLRSGRQSPSSICRALTRQIWGRYVAVLFDHSGIVTGIFRDPSGALETIYWRAGNHWGIASELPQWLTSSRPLPTINWDGVATILAAPSTLTATDLLHGYRTLKPGELATEYGVETIWRPTSALDSEPLNPSRLRNITDDVVATMARDRQGVLVEISGGLDSAVVATSFRSRTGPRALGLNASGPFREADEDAYAAEVAQRSGLELLHHRRRIEDLRSGLAFDHPRTVRPSLNRMDADYDRTLEILCAEHGLDTILTGKGGDVVFVQAASSAVLADQLRDLQFAGSLRSTPYVLASRLRRSVWRVLRSGLVAAAFPRPRDRAPSSLLARDLIPVSPPLHPWLEADDRIAPGKRLQIAGLIAHQALHSLSARNERADLLHPLLSQPIMEVGLATPTYELTAGGHDRMLARQAFADRLPESILHRRSKGELTTYYGRVLAENRAQLLSHLLDGLLARHGLIDRAKVEASLQIENLIWQADYADLMLLTVTENWVRAWKN